jgi:hypothetical protein
MCNNGHTQDTTSQGPHLGEAALQEVSLQSMSSCCLLGTTKERIGFLLLWLGPAGEWVAQDLKGSMLSSLAGSLETQV